MAKCEKCGKSYLTKECINCRDNKESNLKFKSKSKILFATGIVVIIGIGIFFKNYNSNPLIGEWRTKDNLFGKSKIIFKSDSMEGMGIVSKVKYEIEENRVIVTDTWGIGTVINIIDEDTLESNMAGIKTKYKRIK